MATLEQITLQFNRQIKLSTDGGALSSDTGNILLSKFDEKLAFTKTIAKHLILQDERSYFVHTNENLLRQKVYQLLAGYDEDDAADQLTHDPIFIHALGITALASQPSLSRFFSRFTVESVNGLQKGNQKLQDRVLSILTRMVVGKMLSLLTYNLVNWMRTLTFPKGFDGIWIQTNRTRLIKVASKLVKSGRFLYFKLSSRFVYKQFFWNVLGRIQQLPCTQRFPLLGVEGGDSSGNSMSLETPQGAWFSRPRRLKPCPRNASAWNGRQLSILHPCHLQLLIF